MDNPIAPPTFEIPAPTVQRWFAIAGNVRVQVPLARADFDNLFYAVDANTRAMMALQRALIDYTNGQIDSANTANTEATQHIVNSANALRQFMNSVMAGATVA